jgi:hypothetical protein
MTDRGPVPSALFMSSSSGDEGSRGDFESFRQAADLSNVEVAFAREDFRYNSLASDLRQF